MRRIIFISTLFCAAAIAQEPAGVTRGGYSPAFQMMMQQQEKSGVENCSAPSRSAPKCVNPDPGTVHNHPWSGKPPECSDEDGGERGEVRVEEMNGGGKCMMWGYCFCGKQT